MNHDKDILLARYFGGNATKAEMQELESWMAASPTHQQEFDDMTQLYMKLAGPLKKMPSPNRANAKAAFNAYINKSIQIDSQTTAPKRIQFSKKWMAVAASIALIISISIGIWKTPNGEYEVTVIAKSSPKHELLPDKTEIKLSGNSKISYSSNYGKKTKKLKLEGEAKFEVGHAGIGTLQVAAQETFIEDITCPNDKYRLIRKFHTRCTDSFLWNYTGIVKFLDYMNKNPFYDAPFDYYMTNFFENHLDFKQYWSMSTFFIQRTNYGLEESTIQRDWN